MNKNELICITDLIHQRHWTRNLIRDFLGEPDKTVPNPHYPNSHPVKLYSLSRVQSNERSDRFAKRMKLINRHRSLMKAAQKNIKEVM